MYSGERKSILYVLGLYLSSTILLIATFFTSYYYYEQEQFIHSEKEILKKYTLEVSDKLSALSESSSERLQYPRFEDFNSAIYDIDKNLIFSTIEDINTKNVKQGFYTIDADSYLASPITPYYLGAAYIVIQKKSKDVDILNNLIYIAIITVLITVITSFFLVNIVLKPIRENIKLLDNFIKDTTHELNTPITAILANVETIDSSNCDEKTLRKLERIKIASASISNLYQDLIYLLLNHKTSLQNVDLNLSQIVTQRVKYFTNMANMKKIEFILDIKEGVHFFADRQKMERLIDNILSNAIKYTNKSTKITITLKETYLSIEDEGKGMSKNELDKIFTRYLRFDKTQGGFGIGYSIIKSIIDDYAIKIDIESKPNKGTKVTLTW
ncbi:HAMP domain-containing sensor histidine kinase [Sulfurimonas sp.]|uniref:sensor histidine kinase n=1 Tax=Sulfurimonas sp. TaxID=2022749 RepID=UPI0025E6A3EC|nr:HAMP domain-containing sensor histidine kinase [Sulfurimonas sp.]MCK9473713.1 HAMP domain-containing histidine kinase [Sulfurimonas sp.]MDD3506181.1 HAMP domain-containing sensor histidine kinase [Sulfurimonas sp.]